MRRTDVEVDKVGGKESGQSRDQGEPGFGEKMRGMANEAMGNTKQGFAGVPGSESMQQSGLAQERKGEMEQGKGPDKRF